MSCVARILTQLLKLKTKVSPDPNAFFKKPFPQTSECHVVTLHPHPYFAVRRWKEIKTSTSFGSWKTIKNEMNSRDRKSVV